MNPRDCERERGQGFASSSGFAVVLLLGASGAGLGCRSPAGADMRQTIEQVLRTQADAWNAGDLDGFMDSYRRSSDLTFSSGGRILRGWEETRERYRTRYPSRESMGQLTFSQLEISPIGNDAALVLGRWQLHRAEPLGGVFTLLMRRQGGRWVIVHDHTSADSP